MFEKVQIDFNRFLVSRVRELSSRIENQVLELKIEFKNRKSISRIENVNEVRCTLGPP